MDNYNFQLLLKETYDELSARGFETSRADWLLEDITGMSRTEIALNFQEKVPENILSEYLSYRERMYKGEPVQYIAGFAEFYGRKFKVNQDVLIPRPETEELVYQTLQKIHKKHLVLCDIGTGSGAIAISLKKERPDLSVIATDISPNAIAIAKENAKLLETEVEFLLGESLKPLIDRNIQVDILVSNPPYISYDEQKQMSETVLDYEPHLALFAHDDGLAIYKDILSNLDKVITQGGLVIFEIGYMQGDILKTYIQENYNIENLEIIKDINQNNRMIQFNWINQ
ncbi:peptide chain release factor N(5)-glutamine methyltransferase [Mammaliicoccus fleurettii]|uniref:peptide chain release factor N(5)-glutamine methyltransferase n=1 Tax=Mammaliicoccus TaxID=2803850 RepID=UPI00099352E7|nr:MULTISPECIES: peptide chain release factor N(5)-glutamine methyltransferase [Mammaliicoccus]MBW0765291.1 peptide chain release factor N(5)-glutamine methyltransferase [Mammaliicoccus fleurettii]MEB6201388.1 peptide chain release factor N(5)-glutamine methyltransferase [Mammaliicoccus fleurettii]OOV76204.1 protein-(glutamine-N5) methyltransferase, release factor-specific [Mammaliicoccus fleurettii]RIL52057.1 peptide chain release factor N(5)-glutamine methyltransferase [Mammaliicoccus fleuret